MFLISLAILLTSAYVAILAVFIRGSLLLGTQRQKPKTLPELAELPSVSVIVPLRNEEKDAGNCLKALANQSYEGNWNVICINDRSNDNTEEVLKIFCAHNERFSYINIPLSAPEVASPKKRALAAGFESAQGAIFMTTDADCLPPRNWIRSMAMAFTPEIGIVQGPKRIQHESGIISRFQVTEVFGLVSIEAATFALGNPLLASAPSLAYRRELYERVGGFVGLEKYVSGDDDLLVHKMRKIGNSKVAYNLDPDACVTTTPVTRWKELLQQRARWASNGAHYEDKFLVLLLASIYAFYCWLVLSPLLAWTGLIPWSAFFLPLLVKLLLNGIFLYRTGAVLRQKAAFWNFVWCEFIHIPMVVIAVIMGHMGWYKWK